MALLNPFNEVYQSDNFKRVLVNELAPFPYIVDFEVYITNL